MKFVNVYKLLTMGILVFSVIVPLTACVTINECDSDNCRQASDDFVVCGFDRACYERLEAQRSND